MKIWNASYMEHCEKMQLIPADIGQEEYIKKLILAPAVGNKRSCDTCVKLRTMKCPNSALCYSASDKPYWKGVQP